VLAYLLLEYLMNISCTQLLEAVAAGFSCSWSSLIRCIASNSLLLK
jgi:hypothetical protein